MTIPLSSADSTSSARQRVSVGDFFACREFIVPDRSLIDPSTADTYLYSHARDRQVSNEISSFFFFFFFSSNFRDRNYYGSNVRALTTRLNDISFEERGDDGDDEDEGEGGSI